MDKIVRIGGIIWILDTKWLYFNIGQPQTASEATEIILEVIKFLHKSRISNMEIEHFEQQRQQRQFLRCMFIEAILIGKPRLFLMMATT